MEYDEHEQNERVRSWLRQNGSSLITGIAMGLALVFGWQWWQGRGEQHKAEAAGQYQALAAALEAKDAGKAKALSTQIGDKFADTGYAQVATLKNATFLHESGKDAEALALLRAERAGFTDPAMLEIVDIRIARLLLITGKADEAAKELDKLAKPLYPQVVEEMRGDIAIARGNRDEARKRYESALAKLDAEAPTRPLLELKLIDAGGQPPAKPET